MIDIRQLRVVKGGTTICRVNQLTVERGERVAIIGCNGSGKTTLLRVAAGLETQFQGSCAVAAPVRQRVYVHQAPYLFRGTVLSNVTYGLRACGVPRARAADQAEPWLERFGLVQFAGRRAANLSGGERRRVALARALVLRPQLLLLDEPLADIDSSGITALSAALDELPDTTILIATPTPLPNGFATCHIQLDSFAE